MRKPCPAGRKIGRGLYLVLCTVLASFAVQSITWNTLCPIGLYGLLTLSVTGVITVAVWTLVWSETAAGLCTYWLLTVCAYLYECVWLFRGTAFKPLDLLNLRTAVSVAGHYAFPFGIKHIWWILVGIGLGYLTRFVPPKTKRRPLVKLGCIALAAGWMAVLLCTPLLERMGVESTAWEAEAANFNSRQGVLPTLTNEVRQLLFSYPEGYDAEALAKREPDLAEGAMIAGEDRPNVIVVMSEAFMWPDRLLGEGGNEQIMPYFSSLKNTVRGSLYVSAFGGGTCNSEHSFLTGTAPAPDSWLSLLATVKRNTPSLAWHLKGLGYQTVALHPYTRENYQRPTVYPLLGFDTFLSQEDFPDPKKYRAYISDETAYARLMQLYAEKPEGQPLFAFLVTMQNHGPYPEGLEPDEKPFTFEGADEETETYLNLLNASDGALRQLIAFLEAQPEPTVLLIFGDHQANLKPVGEPAQDRIPELASYQTPFLIWSNRPIEAQTVDAISVNYLSALLLRTAGLPMTAYDAWLLDTAEDYPVVNVFGYADASLTFRDWGDGPAPERLSVLDHLRHNRLYDFEHRLKGLTTPFETEKETNEHDH